MFCFSRRFRYHSGFYPFVGSEPVYGDNTPVLSTFYSLLLIFIFSVQRSLPAFFAFGGSYGAVNRGWRCCKDAHRIRAALRGQGLCFQWIYHVYIWTSVVIYTCLIVWASGYSYLVLLSVLHFIMALTPCRL
jgi:hypothetical protein